jgi:hypothetical protein
MLILPDNKEDPFALSLAEIRSFVVKKTCPEQRSRAGG